ncbi:acireductone dioxygenase [Pseudomonas sp. LP_7_YM]|uniref:1,2-dihydroxy-3-keto-5-methylthiopentene dioxygenase n=1 Tax=Pseudomonas sp. LP_7_YM TaxID=2485137 RepID=UPI00106172C1|nr:acireductone dioxygenase [Pseudomonas sp. LP_7_YM]TDV71940.1 acireductone dioxygenase apoprotein [Pseudomonas sp. LP_7_YM]
MSILYVYPVASPELPSKVLTHFEDIASTLAEQGIGFERLPAASPIVAGAGQDDVIGAYRQQIDKLMTRHGHVAADVISVDGHNPEQNSLVAGFLDEHRHDAHESRFFVAGRGLYSLRIGDFVYAVLCEKNDLIFVPAQTRRWFDVGENPRVVAIRLFSHSSGQVAKATGEQIASRFARMDD